MRHGCVALRVRRQESEVGAELNRMIRRFIKFIVLGVVALVALVIVYEVVRFPRVSRLRETNPEVSAMMEQRAEEADSAKKSVKRVQTWTPIERISPNLQRAVIAGEDTNFMTHNGFDYEAIQSAWEDARADAEKQAKAEGDNDPNDWIPPLPSFTRGASTISQQLAKNLYLSTDRSFLRKGREAAITFVMERELSKRRILEIYLNIIEWGDGIYGAEAAAKNYFSKSAASLTPNEAAYLSAMIPNPRTVFNPKINPRRVARRQRVIMRGMPHVKIP